MDLFLVLCSVLFLSCFAAADDHVTGNGFVYNCTGNCQDTSTKTIPGLVLMGGGTDVDEAFQWMIKRSGGGNFVVLRTSGTDAYNEYIMGFGKIQSASTILITSRNGANADFVYQKLQGAEALFIAGGDQYSYVTTWNDTKVSDAIKGLLAKGVPIGGTSAGLMVMGQYIFTAKGGGIESEDALDNPYDQYLTLGTDFINFSPLLEGVITDTHFYQRDRMGRSITFLARLVVDTNDDTDSFKAICVDEQTAILLDPATKQGQVVNFGGSTQLEHSVYFLQTTGVPEECRRREPLTFSDISVYRLGYGDTFDFQAWKPVSSHAAHYKISVDEGELDSTQSGGDIY